MNKINRVILCIIDDVSSEHFFSLINMGILPNFEELMNNGTFSKNCITDFPAITFPAQVSTITGTYTGDHRNEYCHGVPMYDWMDRSYVPPILRSYGTYGSKKRIQIYNINEDMGDKCRTLIEMIDEGNSVSIPQFINRGTNFFFPERRPKMILYYLFIKYYPKIKEMLVRANTIIIKKLLRTFENPKHFFESKEPPIVSLLWFMTSDLLMHIFGYDSLLYKLNLRHIDKVIGYLIEELSKLGYLDDTLIAITSDHGNYKTKKIGNLDTFFKKNRLTQFHPRKNLKGNIDLAEFGGLGFFYFKENYPHSNKVWIPPKIETLRTYGLNGVNLFQELFKIEGTELMYYRDSENSINKGRIFLKRKKQNKEGFITGFIEYEGNSNNLKTKYTVGEDVDHDIFGYLHDESAIKLMDNKYHTIDEWLEATYHLDFPLYPDLLVRHFKNPRSSDIIISTEGRIAYNIKHGKKTSNNYYLHDIGLRKCSVVPLILAGTDQIPKKEITYCKITDIVPSLLRMLGKTPHKSVVGRSLI